MEGYYDKTKFFRVVPEFIVQGGDPTNSGEGRCLIKLLYKPGKLTIIMNMNVCMKEYYDKTKFFRVVPEFIVQGKIGVLLILVKVGLIELLNSKLVTGILMLVSEIKDY